LKEESQPRAQTQFGHEVESYEVLEAERKKVPSVPSAPLSYGEVKGFI
jgi:hypothetical protein